ncbi:MAL7P1.13-like [Cryptosporidium bovis]|uniref:MAL7P1.13-like n=1 Tax=Cryptosporidium bovis TaxID=310047 RepID=UPI00351A14A6|nr:MAL7P1.13-like [Cryptosporidium bovis]
MSYRKNSILGNSSQGVNVYQDDRINRLSQRLSSIHNGLDVDRSSKYTDKLSELESNIKKFDEEMTFKYEDGMKKLDEIRELVFDIKIENENEHKNECEYKAESEGNVKSSGFDGVKLVHIEKRINELLQTEIYSRKTMEQRLMDIIDDKLDVLKSEMLKKDSERQELDNCVKKFVDIDIPRLGNAIKNEIENCKLIETSINKQIKDEIEKLNSIINEEVEARQQSIDALLDLMENLVQRIAIDTKADRTERQNSEDTLLNLLGETLNRIQSVASSIVKH